MATKNLARDKNIYKLLVSGKTAPDIGKMYGITGSRVLQVSRRIHRVIQKNIPFKQFTYWDDIKQIREDKSYWIDLAIKYKQ